MKAGWAIKTIGEVCVITNGGTPKTGVATYWDGPHPNWAGVFGVSRSICISNRRRFRGLSP